MRDQNVYKRAFFTVRGVLAVLLLMGLGACNMVPALAEPDGPDDTVLADLEVASPKQPELVFSAVQGLSSEPQTVTLKNIGGGPLELTAFSLNGVGASSFTVTGPTLPFTIEAGGSRDVAVAFAPTAPGVWTSTLEIESAESGSLDLDLYGLGSEGEQGSNEPTLDQVVTALGYKVDVGGSNLELGKIASSIGDEVMVPLFDKAKSGPVTLEVVARYGPEEVFPYGYFTLGAEEPELQEVGTIAAEDAQELLPPVAGGSVSFDPGESTFGVYGQASGVTQYTVDAFNIGEIQHAMRVYPLKDRKGLPVANSYLIGLEEAENGDYQDVVFVLKNVVPSTITAP